MFFFWWFIWGNAETKEIFLRPGEELGWRMEGWWPRAAKSYFASRIRFLGGIFLIWRRNFPNIEKKFSKFSENFSTFCDYGWRVAESCTLFLPPFPIFFLLLIFHNSFLIFFIYIFATMVGRELHVVLATIPNFFFTFNFS